MCWLLPFWTVAAAEGVCALTGGRPEPSRDCYHLVAAFLDRLCACFRHLACLLISLLPCPGLCTGDGAALVDPARVHQLEGQLGQLAPVLAALAVTMRASMLPSLALLNQRAAAAVEVSSDASRLS